MVAVLLVGGPTADWRAPGPRNVGPEARGRQATRDGGGDDTMRAVECGLVAPDFKAPLRIFSPAYYRSQQPSCLAERMAFYKVPGVTMALFDGRGISSTAAYGVLEAGTARPVTPHSVFEAASATKVLTTVITLRLVERGVLDLDRDVNTYLKSWKVPTGSIAAAEPVTLRLLLTHRAGINRPDKGLPFDDERPPTLRQVLAGEPPALNQGVVLERAPGSAHKSSNIGFLVVQLVLEEATGKSYEQLARELVFAPLGLEASTVHHPLDPGWRSRWGVPHDEKGVAHARNSMPNAVAHGGLVTSASDLARIAMEIGLAYQGRSTRLIFEAFCRDDADEGRGLGPRGLRRPDGPGTGRHAPGPGAGSALPAPRRQRSGGQLLGDRVARHGQGSGHHDQRRRGRGADAGDPGVNRARAALAGPGRAFRRFAAWPSARCRGIVVSLAQS